MAPPLRIPFNRACLAGREMEYLAEAAATGHLSGDGKFTRRCHQILEELLGVPKVLLTTSCTHALEMSALLLDLEPGDEVIMPSFTFVSTANAYVLRGARPVFVDVRSDTLNLDETKLEAAITERTRAIVVVHYAGVACDMARINEIASKHGLVVIEDNAHGLFGKYQGRWLGTLSAMATLSFHETKNIVCGEGGALLINDPALIERAEILREKGTNRSRFFRGQVDKYTWIDVGSSYLPSELVAAFLCAQLESWEAIQERRGAIWNRYADDLSEWAGEYGVDLPTVPTDCEQPYHIFYMLMPSLDSRQRMIERLRERGILSVFHYVPLHLSEMGQKFGGQAGDCPVTEDISDRLIRLPLYPELSAAEQDEIIEVIRSCRP